MLPPLTVTFALWLVMVYQSLIASDHVIKKIVAFIAVPLQQTRADAYTIALGLFCEFL
jgi:hypothetical protein